MEKAAAKAKSYKIGNTLEPDTQIGAQVNFSFTIITRIQDFCFG